MCPPLTVTLKALQSTAKVVFLKQKYSLITPQTVFRDFPPPPLGFFNFSTIDIWGQLILCYEDFVIVGRLVASLASPD